MTFKKVAALAAVGLLSVAFLAACGKSDKGATDTAKKVTTITVAQTADSKPYAYKEGDTLTGYDIEVLKAIDKKLPDYKFDYKIVSDEAILTDLEAVAALIQAGEKPNAAIKKVAKIRGLVRQELYQSYHEL